MLSQKIIAFTKNLGRKIIQYGEASEYQFVTFGIFGFISYPLYYLIWLFTNPLGHENLGLRITASILCIPLIFKSKLPEKILKLLPLYWYLVLIYCISFFFVFMLFKNNFSTIWLLNTMSALVWAVLITDALSLFLIIMIGTPIGWIFYSLTTETLYFPNNFTGILFLFSSVIVFGAIFSVKKENQQKEKLDGMKLLSANMAHELRTPLAAINAGVGGVKEYLPDLIQTYELAQKENLPVPHIRPSQFKTLGSALEHIQAETNFAQTVINMLLVNVDQSRIKLSQIETCSMAHCINEALIRYPFLPKEKELVHWENNGDFIFQGDELLVIHVLFNLLKNALFYVKTARKGDIRIWVEPGTKYNKLHFRDTGTGIAADVLPHIFDRFFSRTYHGSGVGLAFCKMVMQAYGGNISCDSVAGEYAEFVLSFPTRQISKLNSSHS